MLRLLTGVTAGKVMLTTYATLRPSSITSIAIMIIAMAAINQQAKMINIVLIADA